MTARFLMKHSGFHPVFLPFSLPNLSGQRLDTILPHLMWS